MSARTRNREEQESEVFLGGLRSEETRYRGRAVGTGGKGLGRFEEGDLERGTYKTGGCWLEESCI